MKYLLSLFAASTFFATSAFAQSPPVRLRVQATSDLLEIRLLNASIRPVIVNADMPESAHRKPGLILYFSRIGKLELISRPAAMTGSIAVGAPEQSPVRVLPFHIYGRIFSVSSLAKTYALESGGCYMVSASYVQNAPEKLALASKDAAKICIP